MPRITFDVTVQGQGEAPVPVSFPEGSVVSFMGMGSATVPVVIGPYGNTLTVGGFTVSTSSPKVTAALLEDAFVIPAGETYTMQLMVETVEPLYAGDEIVVSVDSGAL